MVRWTNWLSRLPFTQEIASSNLVRTTNFEMFQMRNSGVRPQCCNVQYNVINPSAPPRGYLTNRLRWSPFQGGDTGSNPVTRTNIKYLAELAYCTAPYELGKVVFTWVIIIGSNPIIFNIRSLTY